MAKRERSERKPVISGLKHKIVSVIGRIFLSQKLCGLNLLEQEMPLLLTLVITWWATQDIY